MGKWKDLDDDCLLTNIISPIVSIEHDVSAYDAFKKLSDSNVSALTTVDRYGKLISDVSELDIKYFTQISAEWKSKNVFGVLRNPIDFFWKMIRIKNPENGMPEYPLKEMTLKKNNTLRLDVIGPMLSMGYQRL